jgi:predicted Rossmann fold flavoprotein
VGKKILMSGGGRCNFTNLHASPERYLSANPDFCRSALSRYTQWDFIELVKRHHIEYFEKQTVNGLSGQLFCRQSSKQIVALLLDECHRAGVKIRTACETSSVTRKDNYCLATSQGVFTAETLVIASGGLSIPSLGGSGYGYQLADQFGLRCDIGWPRAPHLDRCPERDLRRTLRRFVRSHGVQSTRNVSRGPVVHPSRPERAGRAADFQLLAAG